MVLNDNEVGAVTLRCDDCDDLLNGDFNSDDFHGMIEFAKAQGWSIRPDGEGGWEHKCPSCAGASTSRLEAQRRLLGL